MSQTICFNQFSKFVLIHLAFLRLVGIELEFIAKIQVETMNSEFESLNSLHILKPFHRLAFLQSVLATPC